MFITETHFINNHVMSEYNEGSGGAIYLSNANVMILNSVFTNNTAFVMTLIGDVNSMSCKFKHFSVFGGGAINLLTSNVSIHGCDFDSNTAKCGGALIINSLGSHTNISNTTFRGNYAEQGGAIYNYNVRIPTNIVGTSFINNSASSGGAIFTLAQLQSKDSVYENNTAKHGGAMYITIFSVTDIQVSFFNSTLFCSNTAEFGGAIKMISGTIRFQPYSETFITQNNAIYGGGIYLEQSILVGTKLEIKHNRANNAGGGIYAFARGARGRPRV